MKTKFLTMTIFALALMAGGVQAQGLNVGNSVTGTVSGATDRVTGNLDAGASTNTRSSDRGVSIDLGAGVNTNANTRAGESGGTAKTHARAGVNTRAGEAGAPHITDNMNAEQFSTYATGRWDANGDGAISKAEWRAMNSVWIRNKSHADFRAWDKNSNGALDSAEAMAVVSASNMYQVL